MGFGNSVDFEVYMQLLEGTPQCRVVVKGSRDKPVTKGRVSKAVRMLVDESIVVRVPDSYPFLYQRGPRAEAYEAWAQSCRQQQGGWSEEFPDSNKCRVHRGAYKRIVASSGFDTVPWDRVWDPTKVGSQKNGRRRIKVDGRKFTICAYEGLEGRSVVIQPHAEYAFTGPGLDRLIDEREAEIDELFRTLEREHGYKFTGPRKLIQPQELGFPVDEDVVPKFGTLGKEPVVGDGSLQGATEIEVKDDGRAGPLRKAAKHFMDGPVDRRLTWEAIDKLLAIQREAQVDRKLLNGVIVRLTDVEEKLEKAVEFLINNHALAAQNGNHNGLPPAPPDNSMEVA